MVPLDIFGMAPGTIMGGTGTQRPPVTPSFEWLYTSDCVASLGNYCNEKSCLYNVLNNTKANNYVRSSSAQGEAATASELRIKCTIHCGV